MEGIEAGAAELAPLDAERIVSAVNARLSLADSRLPVGLRGIYGDGKAGMRCACFIAEFLNPTERCASAGGRDEFHFSPPLQRVLPRTVDSRDKEASTAAIDLLNSFALSDHPNIFFRKSFQKGRISIVLTQYKRNTTEIQLKSIFSQTAANQIDRVVILQNEAHVDISFLEQIDFSSYAVFADPPFKSRISEIIQVVKSPKWNTRYYGRFALGLLFDSEFCAIIDDDTIPQPRFLEAAMALSAERNAIVGPVGVIVSGDQQIFIKPPIEAHLEVRHLLLISPPLSPNKSFPSFSVFFCFLFHVAQVDYVGHIWLFKTEWLRFLWGDHVPSWHVAEDLAFSAQAWLKGRVKSVVMRHSPIEYEVQACACRC
jgi:hypothetical protein